MSKKRNTIEDVKVFCEKLQAPFDCFVMNEKNCFYNDETRIWRVIKKQNY